MGAVRTRWTCRARCTSGGRALLGVGLAAVLAAACTTVPGGGGSDTTEVPTSTTTIFNPPGNDAPVILAFAASRPTGESPLTTAFQWDVVDADLDLLVCSLDFDSNGTTDETVTGCTSNAIRSRTFSAIGATTVTLRVTDFTAPTVSATTSVTVQAPSTDSYGVDLRLNGTMSPTQSAAFSDAAARWGEVIRTGVAGDTLTIPDDDCGTGAPAFSGPVDDVLIDASITEIDGVGGVLGRAGPCYIRDDAAGLPVYGVMQFDVADVAQLEADGQFDAVILHEMGHVLGIGTIWNAPLLTGAGGSNPRFTGPTAIGAWQALGGAGTVPVENSGGSGTADSHWRESILGSELMTGYLDLGPTPLSELTIASLADLGYGVDLGAADPYGLGALRAKPAAAAVQLNVVLVTPRRTP